MLRLAAAASACVALHWAVQLEPEPSSTSTKNHKTSRSSRIFSKLSATILFICNKLDPMTSLGNARKAAESCPGSLVLEVDARGHCALGNRVLSECALGYLRGYLRDGTLPEDGTVCGRDCNVFDGSCFEGGHALTCSCGWFVWLEAGGVVRYATLLHRKLERT